jgi:transcriptional regulator NrdR family protein
MVCLHCSSETQVINSRHQKRLNQVWRRRRCLTCKAVFSTTESADYATAVLVRGAQGAIRPFSRDKLFVSIMSACQHRKTAINDAGGLTTTVIKRSFESLQQGVVDTKAIKAAAYVALQRFDPTAAALYRAYHP